MVRIVQIWPFSLHPCYNISSPDWSTCIPRRRFHAAAAVAAAGGAEGAAAAAARRERGRASKDRLTTVIDSWHCDEEAVGCGA